MDVKFGNSGLAIDITSSGGITISSAISGNNGFTKTGSGSGALILSGANAYSGDTTISAGTLALSGSSTIPSTSVNLTITGGAIFDVSATTAGFTMNSAQTLKASGNGSSGTIATTTSKGLTLGTTSGLQFTAYNGSTAPLTVTGAGSVTLASDNSLTVTVPGSALTTADYVLIAKGTGNTTAANGTAPASVTVNGAGGLASGTTASLVISGGQLLLRVVPITYTVTYNGNTSDGGTAPVDGSSPYNSGSLVTVLGAGTLTKTGNTFTGWNTAANGSGTSYAIGATFNIGANTILYAQWAAAVSCTLTYDGNTFDGGTAPVDGSSPYISGSTVTLLGAGTLTKTGNTFAGWNTAANGSGTSYATGATFSIGANTTLYAQWTSGPVISGAATAAVFTTTYGTASAVQTFSVSGANLSTDLIATAPTGFEVASDGATYGGTATFAQSGGNASGTLSVRFKATANVSGSYNSQNIVLSSTGASSINIMTVSIGNIVTPKTLSITAPSIASKPYDGTTTAGAVTVGTVSGFVGSETVTATATAAAYSSANVASYPNDVVAYTLHDGAGGGLADNYSLANDTATGVITPLALTITAPSIADTNYNGSAIAGAVAVGALSGFVGSEAVTATGSAANYPSAIVGTYPGTVITYTLHNGTGGGLAANYSLATGAATGNIIAKPLTITANSVSKTVGTTLTSPVTGSTAFAITSGSFVGSEGNGVTVTVTYGTGAAAGDTLGTHTGQVIASAATGGTFVAANYNITYTAGDITVVPPLVAGWDFQTTTSGGTAAAAAPGSPLVYTANFGTGIIYLDGEFGSIAWTSGSSSPQVTAFGGTAVNAATGFSTVTSGSSCLALANSSANGQKIIFTFSMANRAGLVVSYAVQRSGTGFTSHLWEYSTDGTTWLPAQAAAISITAASFATTTLTTITGLNGASTAYLRLTVSGATATSGNNRLDNIQIMASDVPTISGVTPSQGISYGSASVTLSGMVSAPGPVYPADGETVNVTINGSTQPATIAGGVGGFSVNFPTATIPPSPTAYTITYVYAGDANLPAAANNTSTALTVTGIKVPNLTYTIATNVSLVITLADIQAAGLASAQGSPSYSIAGVNSPTTAAGTVIFNASNIKYTNSVPITIPDSFSYTVSDGTASGSGLVAVNFTSMAGPQITPTFDANHPVISFHGLPGYSYHIQRATTLSPTPNWTDVQAVSLPSNGDGSYSWTDTDKTVPPDNVFYRLSYP